MNKLHILLALLSMVFSAAAYPSWYSKCVSFKYEKESYYKVLMQEFDVFNIKYSYKKGDVLCYQPENDKLVHKIISNVIPSITPGPNYVLISSEKYSDLFQKHLQANGVVSNKSIIRNKIKISWEGNYPIVISSVVDQIRLVIANDMKVRANELSKQTSNNAFNPDANKDSRPLT